MKKSGMILALMLLMFLTACKTTPKTEIANEITADAALPPLPPEARNHVIGKCVMLCQEAVRAGKNLASGPCLSDGMSFELDWACDVAHYPRQPIDDQPENQCADFKSGTANHFVEVDENCNLIKRH